MTIQFLKSVSFEDFAKRGNRLNADEAVKFGGAGFLAPWTNLFYEEGEQDSKGLGWHDSRILYPDKDIKVFEDLYVLDTSMARTIEARALLQYRDLSKGNKKTQEEMIKYLSKKEPIAHRMCDSKGKSIYTPAFDAFIVSISPTHYLHFGENKKIAEEVTKKLHELMVGILKGKNPNLINYLNSFSTKN